MRIIIDVFAKSPAKWAWALVAAAAVAASVTPILAAPPADDAIEQMIDGGLDDPQRTYPVFVRMADQLLGVSGDYERFCAEHREARRRELRPQIIRTLREKADRSWKEVAELVAELEQAKEVRSVERFWIVNGLACEATGAACRRLAAHEAVSFVYLERGPVRQHRREVAPANAEQDRAVLELAFKDWKDDSDTPFSAEGLEIPWNLKRIGADQAWTEDKVTGRGTVVALLDTGLIVTPALTAALWKNPGEELNGKDDDANGYVDDLCGYDFQAGSGNCLGDSPQIPHGSICAGIVAGRPLNQKNLVTGIAPRSRLMILRGMGYLKSYEYALLHGADVMSMSYMWVNIELGNYRGVYRCAHEHLSAAGIVAVGGAGNFARLPAGKQIALPKDIPCVIAAAGITEDGAKAQASSEGPCTWAGVKFYDDYPADKPLIKPDVTGLFTGYPMWARPNALGGRWQVVSRESPQAALVIGPAGNSFAGPHAAGVAALMLSANPDLCAWDVKRLMEATCLDLGPEGRDTTYGAGLLQAHAAIRAARQPFGQ
jgi:subtilisin family serine protease